MPLIFLAPPLSVLSRKGPAAAALNLLLTICGWIPGVIHAWAIASDDEKRVEATRERAHLRRITGRHEEKGGADVVIVRREPVYTFVACVLACAFAGTVYSARSTLVSILGRENRQAMNLAQNASPQSQVPPDEPSPPVTDPAPETKTPPPSPANPTNPETDNRSLASVLGERVKWPTKVTLRAPITIALFDGDERVGEASLVAGQILTANSISDSGMLSITVGQQPIELEMENTDFVARASKAKAKETQTAAAVAMDNMTDAQVARARREQSVEVQLMALKQRFPPKYRTSVETVIKDRTIRSSNIRTIDVGGGRTVTQVRTGSSPSIAIGHYDAIQIEVPSTDLYSDYRGWVSTATVQGLPITLQKLRLKIQDDLVRLSSEATQGSGSANRVQASATISWIRGTFLPYLNQLEALTRRL